MYWKWRKGVSSLVVSTVLLSLLPFGGVTASPPPQLSNSPIYQSITSNSLTNSQNYITSTSEDLLPTKFRTLASERESIIPDLNEQITVSTVTYEIKDMKEKNLKAVRIVKELVDKRSRNSKTYLNSDGTTTVQSSVYSLNYFDGQAWQAIDTTIRQDRVDPNYTHSMLANTFKVKLSNKGKNQALMFAVDDQSVSYRAEGMNDVTGVVYENTIIYPNAWQNTDLMYQVQNDQLKMELHLANNKAPKNFSFDLGMKNVEYHENKDGSIDFINKNGEISFQVPQMWVKDAVSDEERYDKLKIDVQQRGNNTILNIKLDDQGLQYPIVIDPTTTLPVVLGGNGYTLDLRNDGTVWAWGLNDFGQLGNGTRTDSAIPVQVSGLTSVVAVSAGSGHSLALKQDGTVWSWGSNSSGQLGNGTIITSLSPVQVSELIDVVAINAGGGSSLALKQDGTVWAWGVRVGNGTYNSNTPVQVSGLTNVVAVSSGSSHSLVVKQDGTVWSWGSNNLGQLGDGTVINSLAPVQVSGLANVKAVDIGYGYSIAVKQDGTVWSWGNNNDGQLGNGTNINSLTPVQVSGLENVLGIASGEFHSLALKENGTVWSWGYNRNGQLGNGTLSNSLIPVQVNGLTNVISITTGASFSVALMQDGTRWSWGSNSKGELGFGQAGEISLLPRQVSSLTNILSVAVSGSHSLVLKQDGTVWSWGDNNYGQLGNGTKTGSPIPVQVSGLTSFQAIATGDSHSLAVKQDGTVWAWGNNNYGQLGNGTKTESLTPVQVSGLTNTVAVKAGFNYSLALKQDGTVWAWGNNLYGQLGNGTNNESLTPVKVSQVSSVASIAVGLYHSLAVKQDGTVWAWGQNSNGQLGIGTLTIKNVPVQVSSLMNIRAVEAGSLYSLAVKQDGTVWSWGYNVNGQLGNGTKGNSQIIPAQVSSLTNVKTVMGGISHSFAVKQDGTVWSWGYNLQGQLGNGTKTESLTPVQVSGLTNVLAVGVGGSHSIGLKQDGTVWSWGLNNDGQLGDGSGSKKIPVIVTNTNIFVDTQAPTAPNNLTIANQTNTSVNLTWSVSTDNVGVIGYDIYKGSVLVASVNESTTSYTIAGLLANTTYTFTVKAKDLFNNISAASNAVIFDNQAPTAPSGLTISERTPNSATLSWSASTDNVGVTGYDIFNGTTLLASVNGSITSYTVTGLLANTSYTITVKAKDFSANISVASNTVIIDTQAPTAPTGIRLTSMSVNSQVLRWSASTDNVGVVAYDIYNGSVLLGSVNVNTTTYAITGLIANNSYTFAVKAKDASGNISDASTIQVLLVNSSKYKYNYDQNGRLTSITIEATGEVLQNYHYDNNGNLNSITQGQ